MADTATLYRIQSAFKKGGASWGDTKYYETFEGFQAALLNGIADIEVERRDITYVVKRGWWRFKKENSLEEGPDTTKLYSAHELVDGEWVKLSWTFTVPEVVITREI